MSTSAIQPIHGPTRPMAIDDQRVKMGERLAGSVLEPANEPAMRVDNQDTFEMTQEARRRFEALGFDSIKDPAREFTEERIREIAERIASGFYDHPEVIEAIVQGYRKEFEI